MNKIIKRKYIYKGVWVTYFTCAVCGRRVEQTLEMIKELLK